MKKAAFFDIDGTLIRCLSQQVLTEELIRNKSLSLSLVAKIYFWFFLYKAGLVNTSIKLRENAYSVFAHKTKDSFGDIFRAAIKKIIPSRICAGMETIVNTHRDNGDLIFAISGGLMDLCEPICREFNITKIYATRLRCQDGRYTGAWEGNVWEGERKAELIKSLSQQYKINLQESFAYADSYSDLPMLQTVGNPVSVNPDNRLRKWALNNNWPMLKI